MPHATELLGPCAGTMEPVHWNPGIVTTEPTHTQQQQQQQLERGVLSNFPSSGPEILVVRLGLRDVIRNGTETDRGVHQSLVHTKGKRASILLSDCGRKVTDVTLHPHSEMFCTNKSFWRILNKKGTRSWDKLRGKNKITSCWQFDSNFKQPKGNATKFWCGYSCITGFPSDWLSDKEPACNAGDAGSILGLGRSSGEGNSNPL